MLPTKPCCCAATTHTPTEIRRYTTKMEYTAVYDLSRNRIGRRRVYVYSRITLNRPYRLDAPKKLTVRDQSKNFSSPGNIVCHDGRYIMCYQSYCREHGGKFGNENCRVFFSESRDLETGANPIRSG